jgi:Forkhead domain
MKNDFFIDIVSLKPNAESNLLYGTQYPTNQLSYIEFCRALAERDEPKEYVCPRLEDSEIERVPILEQASYMQRHENVDDKPQESYAYMIYKALECSAEGKLTLADIYSWIEKMYPYYQTADPVWKNSIRHNLSLNAAFKKIPRPPSSKGKGGYWAIDHNSQKSGKAVKKRRSTRIVENQHVSRNLLNENPNELIF